MGRFLAFSCILLAAATASGQAASGAPVAGLDVLLDELDELNAAKAAQAREMKTLKAQVRQIEERLRRRSDDATDSIAKRLDALETELAAARDRVAELEAAASKRARTAGPTLIPTIEFRLRTIAETNRFDLDGGLDDSDLFFQHRLRAGLTLQFTPDVEMVVAFQDAREWAEERSTTTDGHSLDLFEGFLRLRDIGGSGIDIQAGRMRLQYGANRQVSARNSNAVGQVFDGVRLAYRRPRVIQVDLFATLARTGIAPLFQSGRGQSPYSVFSGLYLRTDALDGLEAELYGLYLDDGFNDAVEKIGTVGTRLVGRPAKGLYLEAEAAVQFGRVEVRDLAARRLVASHLAAMAHAQARYRFDVATAPSLGVFVSFATGDANPFDQRSRAYRPGFHSRHNVFGLLDLFTWQGVLDIGPSFRLAPHKDVSIELNYHAFFLSSNSGLVKAFNTESSWLGDDRPLGEVFRHVSFPAGGSRFLGQEMDLIVGWRTTPWLRLDLEYGFFVPGPRTRRAQVLSVAQVEDPQTMTTRDAWARDGWIGSDWAHRGYLVATVEF